MIYRRSGRGRFLLLVFLILAIGLITLDFRRDVVMLEMAKETGASIVAPVQRGLTSVLRPIGNFFSSLGELSHLRSENAGLKQRLEATQARIEQAEQVLDENRELTAELGIDPSWATRARIAAQVTARVPSNYKWAVVIDKGAEHGVRADMPVVDHDGLVGKVVSAAAHESTVLLLIDPQGAAGARIRGVRDTGVVTGNGGNEPLSLEFISPETKVKVGDEVVTSGYDRGVFPPAIPIGEVVGVSGDSAGLEQVIQIEPFVRFTSLDYVQVITEVDLPANEGRRSAPRGTGGGHALRRSGR